MNKVFKIFSAAAVLLVLGSCTKNFEKYNTDPYSVQKEDPSILLPTMIDALMYVQQNDSQMVDQMVGTLACLVKAAAMMRVADCYGPIPYV